MRYKMMVTDMDGTLLNKDSLLSKKTKDNLKLFQAQGLILVLASGRNYNTMIDYAKELEMQRYGGYLIGVNGQQLTDLQIDETKVLARIDKLLVQEAFAKAIDYDMEFMGVLNDQLFVYVPKRMKPMKQEYAKEHGLDPDILTGGVFSLVHKQNYENIKYIDKDFIFDQSMNKIVFHAEEAWMNKYRKALEERFNHELELTATSKTWLEASPKNISKGNTLRKLANHLGIKRDEIMVFGDGENDLSMFKEVEAAYAVSNAMERVKAEAKEVIGHHHQDGVINKVIRIMMGEEDE